MFYGQSLRAGGEQRWPRPPMAPASLSATAVYGQPPARSAAGYGQPVGEGLQQSMTVAGGAAPANAPSVAGPVGTGAVGGTVGAGFAGAVGPAPAGGTGRVTPGALVGPKASPPAGGSVTFGQLPPPPSAAGGRDLASIWRSMGPQISRGGQQGAGTDAVGKAWSDNQLRMFGNLLQVRGGMDPSSREYQRAMQQERLNIDRQLAMAGGNVRALLGKPWR